MSDISLSALVALWQVAKRDACALLRAGDGVRASIVKSGYWPTRRVSDTAPLGSDGDGWRWAGELRRCVPRETPVWGPAAKATMPD